MRIMWEFNLDLVTTLPSVIYHVYKSDGTMVNVDNPHNYPCLLYTSRCV